jgi:hypothetical protein
LVAGSGFGTTITSSGAGMVLQPGFYLVHFDAGGVQVNANPPVVEFNVSDGSLGSFYNLVGQFNNGSASFSADRLIQIVHPNATANFSMLQAMTFLSSCTAIVVQLN